MGYFGIPFRNGVPIGLGSVVSFGAQQFDPSELFVGGTAGAWYDPSDSTTLFSDRAGTTPCGTPGGGSVVPVGRMLDKSGNGNHATAANDTTARPELRARVNLLTRSEEFDNADWVKLNATVSANAGVAPDGTNTADLVYPSSSGNYHGSVYQTGKTGNRLSVCAKAAGFQWLYFVNTGGSAGVVWFDVLNGITGTVGAGYTATITSLGNGWYRCTVEAASGNFLSPQFGPSNADNGVLATASGTNGLLFWGADLRPANIGAAMPAYQRISDANTYDAVGFPRYLVANGTSSIMTVPGSASAMKFLHSDVSSVCIAANVGASTNPAAFYAFFGSNSSTTAQIGVFFLYDDLAGGRNDALRLLTTNGDGIVPNVIDVVQNNQLLPVRPNVVFYNSDPANATTANRFTGYVNNGSALAGNTGTRTLSTSNSSRDVQLFADGSSTLLGLMNFYGLIIVNATITGGQRTATQNWIANKMGVTLP